MGSLKWFVWWVLVVLLVYCVSTRIDDCHALSFATSNGSLRRLDCPEERASLNAFYATHFSHANKQVIPPPAKERDKVYIIVDCQDSNITIAAVRLCPEHHHEYVLLRSLCVSKCHRRQGLALKLMREAMNDYSARNADMTGFYCFADASLKPLYQKAGFMNIVANENFSRQLPDGMWRSFDIVSRRMKRKHQEMQLFVKLHHTPVNFIVLQHLKEQSRPTSTAPLLLDRTLYKHVNIDLWTWSGRCDNERIGKNLDVLTKEQGGILPLLLWPGGNGSVGTIQRDNISTPIQPFHIILDGTWQEAQKMFRKLSILQTLPRGSIQSSSASAFVLRADYTGWKRRFGSNGNGPPLLCTAEVVAAVLENRGDHVGGDVIRRRLDEFQKNYGKQQQQQRSRR